MSVSTPLRCSLTLQRPVPETAERHRADRQRAEAAVYGDRYRASRNVFTNLNGDPLSPGRLTHVFQKILAEYRLRPVRMHDLRHGAATLALGRGCG